MMDNIDDVKCESCQEYDVNKEDGETICDCCMGDY